MLKVTVTEGRIIGDDNNPKMMRFSILMGIVSFSILIASLIYDMVIYFS